MPRTPDNIDIVTKKKQKKNIFSEAKVLYKRLCLSVGL